MKKPRQSGFYIDRDKKTGLWTYGFVFPMNVREYVARIYYYDYNNISGAPDMSPRPTGSARTGMVPIV